MTWTTVHVFAYQEVPTAANINIFGTDLNETAPAKVTTKGDMVSATGANAIARVPGTAVRFWGPLSNDAESSGMKFAAVPPQLDYSYASYVVNNNAGEVDTWSKALDAGVPGAKEMLWIKFPIIYFNNSGSTRTFTAKFYIGTTAYSVVSGAFAASATNYLIDVEIMVRPLNALNSQLVTLKMTWAGVLGTGATVAFISASGTGSDDFATSKTIKFSITHSLAHASLTATVYHPPIILFPAMT